MPQVGIFDDSSQGAGESRTGTVVDESTGGLIEQSCECGKIRYDDGEPGGTSLVGDEVEALEPAGDHDRPRFPDPVFEGCSFEASRNLDAVGNVGRDEVVGEPVTHRPGRCGAPPVFTDEDESQIRVVTEQRDRGGDEIVCALHLAQAPDTHEGG